MPSWPDVTLKRLRGTYNADTTGIVRADYLHKMQKVYRNEIYHMQDMADNSTNPREVAQVEKRKEKLIKQLKVTREYDEKNAHLALSRIEIDLDKTVGLVGMRDCVAFGRFERTGLGTDREAREATNIAFNFLKANGGGISSSISTTTKDYIVNYQLFNLTNAYCHLFCCSWKTRLVEFVCSWGH